MKDIITKHTETCDKCGKIGLYKMGICSRCRKVNCVKCGKSMLSKYEGHSLCCVCRSIKVKKENNGIGV